MSKVEDIFQTLEANITDEKAAKLKGASFLFDVAGEKYLADFDKGEAPYIKQTSDAIAKCNVAVANADDWVDIVNGKLNPTAAFMSGKIKVTGDMSLAMKLSALI